MNNPTEMVVAISLAILGVVFFACVIILIYICRNRFNQHKKLVNYMDFKQDGQLITEEWTDMELDDVNFSPQFESILSDSRWVDDATGLVPHCLDILKTCHQLTEYLVALAMGPVRKERVQEIAEVCRLISPRVDDVVRSMYPPLDPRLLEARTSALVLSVSQLALIVRSASNSANATHFQIISTMLADMNDHLRVLREAALNHEAYLGEDTASVGGPEESSA